MPLGCKTLGQGYILASMWLDDWVVMSKHGRIINAMILFQKKVGKKRALETNQ